MNYSFPIKLFVLIFFSFQAAFGQSEFVTFQGNHCYQIDNKEQQKINLGFQIKANYHIQAADLKNENLIPTKLTFEGHPGIEIKSIHYPKPVKLPIQGNDNFWDTFYGDLEIEVELAVSDKLKVGKYELKGHLLYQPCDDTKCYFPRKLEFRVLLLVK